MPRRELKQKKEKGRESVTYSASSALAVCTLVALKPRFKPH